MSDDRIFDLLARLDSGHLVDGIDLSFSSELSRKYLKDFRAIETVTSVNLTGCDWLVDEDLQFLEAFPNLEFVCLSECPCLGGKGLRYLENSKTLKQLNLFQTNVAHDGLTHISALRSLVTLNLTRNYLSEGEVLRHLVKLTNLNVLNLWKCGELGEVGLRYIAELSALTVLSLGHCTFRRNTLRDLRKLEALRELDLRGSQSVDDTALRILDEISLPSLAKLDVEDTPIRAVARETLGSHNAQAIFSALRSRALDRIRVCILGTAGVGKTSLHAPLFLEYSLAHDDQPPKPTRDISLIRPENISWRPKTVRDGREIQLLPHVWDFGGQFILHGVHEEFIWPDGRTIYLLAVSAARPPQRARGQDGEEVGNAINYWLRTIGSLAGNAPIVIAITQCDKFSSDEIRPIDDPLAEGLAKLADMTPAEVSSYVGNVANVVAIVDGCSSLLVERESRSEEWKLRDLFQPRPQIENLRRALETAALQLDTVNGRFDESTLSLIEKVEDQWVKAAAMSMQQLQALQTPDQLTEPALYVLRDLGCVFFFGITPAEKMRADVELTSRQASLSTSTIRKQNWRRPTPTASLQNTLFNPYFLKFPLYEVMFRLN